MLGVSWRTSLTGWILIGAAVLALIGDTLHKGGIPDTLTEWFMFGTATAAGIGNILAKDGKVSNAKDVGSPKDVPAGL